MISIQIGLNANGLSLQMGKMRDWLDAEHIEAAGFSYRNSTACLVFRGTRDTRNFSKQFAQPAAPKHDNPTTNRAEKLTSTRSSIRRRLLAG